MYIKTHENMFSCVIPIHYPLPQITLSYIQIQHEVVCTLGPACWDVDQLETLIDAGMSVARFNFSHGDHEGHKACLDRLRQAAKNKDAHVGKCYLKVVLSTLNIGRTIILYFL